MTDAAIKEYGSHNNKVVKSQQQSGKVCETLYCIYDTLQEDSGCPH